MLYLHEIMQYYRFNGNIALKVKMSNSTMLFFVIVIHIQYFQFLNIEQKTLILSIYYLFRKI